MDQPSADRLASPQPRGSVRSRRDQLAAGVRAARRTGALHVLIVLLLPIPFLLVAHQLYFWDIGPFDSHRWAVNSDRSVIEVLGYVELLTAAVMLLVVGARRRWGAIYVGWSVTLVFVVVDDSLQVHERGGAWLHHRGLTPELFGLPQQELGELATWGLIGMPVLLLLWATHRVSPRRAREDSWWLAGLTVLLMAFAIGLDLGHEVIEELTDNSVVDLLVTFLEAAGELGAMTVLLAYVVHLTRNGPRSTVAVP